MKVNEIFYSLQGEGRFTGTPAVFLRFSGCNLKCSFCDTSHDEGVEMQAAEIIGEILKYPSRHIVITAWRAVSSTRPGFCGLPASAWLFRAGRDKRREEAT